MSGLDAVRPLTAYAALPDGVPSGCPGDDGDVVALGTLHRVGRTEVNRDLWETPPGWAAVAVARRRALATLRRDAWALGDGVVGITFAPDDGGVVARGLAVRHRRVPAAPVPDELFTTHLPLPAADLAVEAGLLPRRLVVTAVRAALHDPLDTWPEPAFPAAGERGSLEHLAGAARDAAAGVWRAAGRRRGPATVVVGEVDVEGSSTGCSRLARVRDDAVVLVATATVLAGAVDRSPRALDLAESLDRVVVPLGPVPA